MPSFQILILYPIFRFHTFILTSLYSFIPFFIYVFLSIYFLTISLLDSPTLYIHFSVCTPLCTTVFRIIKLYQSLQDYIGYFTLPLYHHFPNLSVFFIYF